MFGAFGGLLGQSTEKKRQQQFISQIRKQDKTDSEIEFISKFLETTCKSNSIEQIKGTLEKEEYDQVIKLIKFADLKSGEEVPSESNQFELLHLTIVIQGAVELQEVFEEKSELVKKYEVGELIFLNQENKIQLIQELKPSATYKLISSEDAQVVYFQRQQLNSILQASAERFEKEFKTKIQCLNAVFPNIAKSEQGTQRQKSKYFKLYPQAQKGTVITTTTSGSNDTFVISKGSILVWIPKSKINQDYSEEFILIGLLPQNSMFNESYVLFNKECIYGTMMIGDENNEIFQLSKDNIGNVCDNSSQDYLKASSEIKDRMYKNHIKRYLQYTPAQILQKQKEFCQKLNLDFSTIVDLFKKSTKDKKIVTHNLINKKEFNKNLENFNKLMKNSTFKTTELQGDREDIASTVTPRLVSRANGLNSLTPSQQLSLIALRQSGKGLRDGTRNTNQKISDLDFDKAEQEKQTLAQLTSNSNGFLIKKNIQHMDLTSKSIEQKEKKETPEESKETLQPIANKDLAAKKSLHQKLEVSNNSLLQKLGQIEVVKQVQSNNDDKEGSKSNQQVPAAKDIAKPAGCIQMSEFSLKTTNKDKPFNSVFLNIAKEEIVQVDKPKTEDKFAQQRKKLLNFGI